MTPQRTVMFVHAHPDDETTKGGELAAHLAATGTRTVLVTCTDGSAGDVTDPDLVADRSLAEVRSEELAVAAQIMGFDAVHELGYPDSGVESEVDGGFANLSLAAIVPGLVELIAAESPDVIVTYDPAYAAGHPDHLQCYELSAAAFARTSALTGEPRKLYGTRFLSERRVAAMEAWMVEHELKSPYARALAKMGDRPPENFTTRIAIGPHTLTARQALRAHITQIAHDHRWFYSIPDDAIADLYPWAEAELLATAEGIDWPTTIESDLFAGLT